jgi:hypothetical protein
MASKSDFTPSEWQQIVSAPQMASVYVALASPTGPVGVMQELMAWTKPFIEAMKVSSGNSLIDAVAADLKEKAEKREKVEPAQMSKDPKEMRARSLQACSDLAALLSQKAPEEAEGYKRMVYHGAQLTAEAGKEGGFMGIGGVRVNDAEVAALKELAGALGIAA